MYQKGSLVRSHPGRVSDSESGSDRHPEVSTSGRYNVIIRVHIQSPRLNLRNFQTTAMMRPGLSTLFPASRQLFVRPLTSIGTSNLIKSTLQRSVRPMYRQLSTHSTSISQPISWRRLALTAVSSSAQSIAIDIMLNMFLAVGWGSWERCRDRRLLE
jgi:hypothetical protein